MAEIEREYRYESPNETRERLDSEIAEADGRVELVYESQNAGGPVSVRGDSVEPMDDLELVRVSTSQRESDLVLDHNHSVRTAVPHEQTDRRRWKHYMGKAIAVRNLTETNTP